MNDLSVTEIAMAMRAADFPPQFDADESRFLIKLLQLVAEGSPVPRSTVDRIATRFQMSLDKAASLIRRKCEHDADGNVVGVFGLSQCHHPHRFTVDGRVLSTWCAWDALFLPVLLRKTSEVESTCPATGAIIHARISPDKIESIQPSRAVISIVLPKATGKSVESAEIRNTFCCHVHFFVSKESAAKWISANNADLSVLSAEDGYELGRLAFELIINHTQHRPIV